MSPKQTAPTRTSTPDAWAGSLQEWQLRAGPHNVTLKSGQPVTFRLMSLRELMLRDAVPDDLRELVALDLVNQTQGGINAVIATETLDASKDPAVAERLARHLRQAWELTKLLVVEGLLDPRITLDDIAPEGGGPPRVPFDDVEELAMLITGRQAFDSRGVRIGVEELQVLATFRDEHGCPEGCAGCDATLRRFSSVDVGAL